MLSFLHIQNFTLVEHLELDFAQGLSVLTGETGAGKSILLGALGLALGDRADADKVRQGATKADVSAGFDVGAQPHVQAWLQQAGLESDAANTCLLRRSLNADGRSRAFVNGQAVPLNQLRQLGALLIDIHSQHEHQQLLNPKNHGPVLDAFGQCSHLTRKVAAAFSHWQGLQQAYQALLNRSDELNARWQLVQYQVQELDQLALQPDELPQLEAQQKALTHAASLAHTCEGVHRLCVGDKSLAERLHKGITALAQAPMQTPPMTEAHSLLQTALIQIKEAAFELERQLDAGPADPFALQAIEQRLSRIYDTARKHRVRPEALVDLHQHLSQELASLTPSETQLSQLQQAISQALAGYQHTAEALTQARSQAAQQLQTQVNQQLAQLAMAHAQVQIALNSKSAPSAEGNEQVEFLISTVPGSPARALAKIASGGELSRVSLALAVVTAHSATTPTIVFDEVDVGIGGETGHVVGRLLRTLGENCQVLCVTHLPQVASQAHCHLKVSKQVSAKGAFSQITPLSAAEKVAEIARMMGGQPEVAASMAYAEALLQQAQAD